MVVRNVSKDCPQQSKISDSSHPLAKRKDKMLGYFWNSLWDLSISSVSTYKFRFGVLKNENWLFLVSRQRAHAAFWNAYKNVPAYHQFIGDTPPLTFQDIPITTKDNYIKPYVNSQRMSELAMHGQLPFGGQIDTSTGTTGQPTPWVRSIEEINTIKKLSHYAAQLMVGEQSLLVINAFALGPWATGMTVTNMMRERGLVFSTGPDKEKIFNILKQFPPENYPKLRYLVTGYPPFIKELAESAILENLNLDKYGMVAIVGGEEMSDASRYQSLGVNQDGIKTQPGFQQIISTYGASDIDINIGYATKFEMALRDACKKNPDLKNDLFGEQETIPSIFHWDPGQYYIEPKISYEDTQVKPTELLYTCVRNDRSSPRIRYNLGDVGMVKPLSEVKTLLTKHKIKIHAPNTTLPLLFIWGRDGVLNYRSAKVPAAHLEEAICCIPDFKNKIQNFAFNTIEKDGKQHVDFLLELKPNLSLDLYTHKIYDLKTQIIETIANLNQDFKFQVKNAPPEALPHLKIFSFGESPMSNQDPHRKKKYLFNLDLSLRTQKTAVHRAL